MDNERWWNAAASAQTAQICSDVLRIREDSITNDSPKRGAGNDDRFVIEMSIKIGSQIKRGFNLCFYYKGQLVDRVLLYRPITVPEVKSGRS